MTRMKPPHVPEVPVQVVTDPEIVALLKACRGTSFEAKRDTAIVRLFIDTGIRRAELSNLRVGPARRHSGGRRPSLSTATSAHARSTRTRTSPIYGSASAELWE